MLLVEDNEPDARLVRSGLAENNPNTILTVATTGEAAIEFLERTGGGLLPDFILLDLNLPGKSGHDVLRFIKQNPRLRRIPVVVLTSSLSDVDVDTAYDTGANLYVRKPSDLDSFFAMVADLQHLFGHRAVLPTQSRHQKFNQPPPS